MANTNLDQVIDVIGQDVRDILRRLDDLGISINNITVSTNDRVNKSGDTMTGILEIDKGDSYVRGKVGRTNKWYVGKGSSSSDDITLWSDVYNSGVTLKRDRTEVTKPLYVGDQKVLLARDGSLIASIAFFAIDTAPSGWLKANGAAVSRTTYADLFAQIGTTFGAGDGRTTFNLPDLRGEFIRGWDDGRRIDALRRLGSSQSDAIKTHKIRVVDSNSSGNNLGIFYYGDRGGAGNHTHNELTYYGADETRPRNVALLACIKY